MTQLAPMVTNQPVQPNRRGISAWLFCHTHELPLVHPNLSPRPPNLSGRGDSFKARTNFLDTRDLLGLLPGAPVRHLGTDLLRPKAESQIYNRTAQIQLVDPGS